MDFGFAVLLAFFYHSIVNQHIDTVAAYNENFDVIEDQSMVDELARKYAKHRDRWLTTIKNNIFKEKESGGICDKGPRLKTEFCSQVLAPYGYEFTSWNNEALICQPNTLWIIKRKNTFWGRHSKKVKEQEKNYVLEMYSCPDIFYKDLESGKDIPVDDRYYVSRGQKEDAAIVFFQQYKNTNDDRIYPRKYIQNIAFQRFLPLLLANLNPLPATHQPDTHTNIIFDPISIEEKLISYGRAIKLSRPYDKFRLTFSSTNICGHRKPHKAYLCRESIKAMYGSELGLRFDPDYDDYTCRKRIKLRISIWNDANFGAATIESIRKSFKKSGSFYKVKEVSLFFLHCPQMLPTSKNNDFVYLASNLDQRSVILYMRTNDLTQYLDMTAIISELSMEKIAQDNRRTRLKRYPLPIERQEHLLELKRNYLRELELKSYSMYSSVQTPTTIAKADSDRLGEMADSPKPIRLIQKRRLAEDIVIKYSEIKTMKLRKE